MKLKTLAGLAVLATTQSALANIDIQFDFTYDTNGFFSNSNAVNALNAAASLFENSFTDSLAAITSSGSNNFTATFFDPAHPFGTDISLSNQSVGLDIIRVYAGGANLGGGSLGIGGPGGFGCSGSGSFCSATTFDRGQGDTSGVNATDVAPWGGAISFNSTTNWNYSVLNGPSSSQYDFYSVAVHELAHVLGFGASDSFAALVSNGNFNGPTTGPVPLYTDDAHWAKGTMSTVNGVAQEAAMDPDIANGQRKYFTDLDFAAMKDIGWQVSPVPEADTWAMLLVGLGLVGMVARRRSGSAA
jgi:MYXO-CTERM domain-containing protein